jgi:prepilin-type N-terminal cleavage/methylation domain-containing protein
MKLRQTNISQSSSIHWLMSAYCKAKVRPGQSGFTLIELLVALIVGSIITILVLGFTVQLMTNNQREAARSDTQREVQAALDYINRDVREAVYVYDGECLRNPGRKSSAIPATIENTCPGILSYLPGGLNTANNLPVLAFWRLDDLPDTLLANCRANAAAIAGGTAGVAIANVPCSSRKMYTLVVYSLNNNNPVGAGGTTTWRGRTRITRYTLPQFTEAGATTETAGWFSPLARSFPDWPRNPRPPEGQPALPAPGLAANLAGNNQVLVDFIDDRTADTSDAGDPAACPNVNGTSVNQSGGFYPTPDQAANPYAATTISRRTFYACVRGADAASLNQEVIVRIQGNAAGQPGIPANINSLPITMETRILTRGVLGKS